MVHRVTTTKFRRFGSIGCLTGRITRRAAASARRVMEWRGMEEGQSVTREPLLTRLRGRFTTIALVWADAGYTGRLLVWARDVLHLTVQIVKRTEPGFVVLPRRWVVERTFAWISKHRRCVRDYETKPDHHEAMIHIAMIMTMSRRLARTGNW